MGRSAHLRETDDRIVPAEIVCNPYPGDQPQTYKYSGGTKDSPVDANEHRTKIPVARRGNYLCFVHCNGKHGLTETGRCESGRRRIIAWELVWL